MHGARLDALQERLTQLSASSGFEGRVVLIGDDAMGESDCRVEWADGGVEREAGRIWRAVEEALDTIHRGRRPRSEVIERRE